MKEPTFIPHHIYKRSTIHDDFGGNRQSGISVSAKHPYIFIFSGKAGHQHGYKDQWENPDVFSYTGEGQVGDMEFIKGNLALQNHISSGKRVFLFIYIGKGVVEFESELELLKINFFEGEDREGNLRSAIKFFFKRAGKHLVYEKQVLNDDGGNDEVLKQNNIPNETERKGLVTSRIGQGAYRTSVLMRWKYKCAVTSFSNIKILIASHIVPWKGATNEERVDVNNGILLSPTYDALFDKHLISFEDNGKIILSSGLSKSNYQDIGITGNEKINGFSKENHIYLARHRMNLND